MTLLIEPRHDLTPDEVDALEMHLCDFNSRAIGRDDARGLGFVIHDAKGAMIGAAAGYSWAATSELKQMWVDDAHRGQGHARALLDAFIAEAARRGVKRIWVQSYSFQAPSLYEKAGFVRVATFDDWPDGHANIVLCLTL